MKLKDSPNGHPKKNGNEIQEELQYPVTFELKAVFDARFDDTENKKHLEGLFSKQMIPFDFLGKKTSSKGTYTSYSYQVTISDKALMESLYDGLKQVPGLKTAL